MIAILFITIGILCFKLYPISEALNREIASVINSAPGVLSQLAWDILSIPTWFIFLVAACAAVAIVRKLVRHRKLRGTHIGKVKSVDDLQNMGWDEFETFTSEIYEKLGYKTEVLGGSGGDGGIDVIAKKGRHNILIQCKKWKDNVGVSVVREMFGVMHAQKFSEVHIITTTGFTSEAIQFAQSQRKIKILGPTDILELIHHGKGYYRLLH